MRKLATLLSLALLALPSPAHAWNKSGHMVSAAIAYRVLEKESPETLAKVIALLEEHPLYAAMWEGRLESVPAQERDLYLFMLAARWPDDMRDDHDFDEFAVWHYINLPLKPEGQPASVHTAEPPEINIRYAFNKNLEVLKNSQADDGAKAIALCWLFHLLGDVHQPLHTVTLFTTDFPKGDRGGTRFYIRAKPDTSVISLHKYWDDLIIGTERYQSVRNRAIGLHLRPSLSRQKLTELGEHGDFEQWLRLESFELAKTIVYRNGKLAGSASRDSAPPLPANYAARAKTVAERRVVLAGYRLADLLKAALAD